MCYRTVKPSYSLCMDGLHGLHLLSGLATKRRKRNPLNNLHPYCGTYGCILPDRHPGLHQFTVSSKRRPRKCGVSNDIEKAAQALVDITTMHPEEGDPVWQAVIREQTKEIIIFPTQDIPSLRVQRWWSANETHLGRGSWYRGTITHISKDDRRVRVCYDDGDLEWELLTECHFLS